MNEKEINEILQAIFYGQITLTNLPVNLYEYYADELQKAVYKGYKGSLKTFTVASDEWNLLNHFRENVNIFSGAKTFQQIRDSQNFILDAEGQIRPFYDYLQDVKKIDAVYRESWLRVERDTAIAQGQSARKWMDIEKQKEILPYLKYHTQEDERVRHSHAVLNGFVAEVNDNIWDSIMPQNEWGCRCWIEQLQEATPDTGEQIQERIDRENEKREPDERIKSLKEIPDKLFRMNPAKDKIIFKNQGIGSHPYFKVDKAFEVLKTNNFGMDINYGL
jgi:SPP1 gp7 family putative phage head morphogenesis protein